MKAPAFWGPAGGAASGILAPLGWLYGFGTALRFAVASPWHAPVPVICVGNAIAGGAGKTPVALDIAHRLKTSGRTPHLLTRGYGGSLPGPVQVDPTKHESRHVGDEALLLAAAAPTWVSRDRASGARASVESGTGVLVMDDGFQNPGLVKDLSLLVVDGGYGFGNGRMIPAGPLREPLGRALERCQAIVLVGEDRVGVADEVGPSGPVILRATVVPGPDATALAGQRVVAFAGIGRPAKFFETLTRAGAEIVRRHAFSDHYPYALDETDALLAEARRLDAVAVTTAKDYVRLPAKVRDAVQVLTIGIEWEDEAAVSAMLDALFDIRQP